MNRTIPEGKDAVVLQTERLSLRRWRQTDLPALARWNADPRFMRYMGRGPLTPEESAAALTRYQRHWSEHGFGLFAIEDRAIGFRLLQEIVDPVLALPLLVHALERNDRPSQQPELPARSPGLST